MNKPTLHIPGLFHTQTDSRKHPCCAFSRKVEGICRMMFNRGWNVIHYGNGGATPPKCTEHVEILNEERFIELGGLKDIDKGYDPNTSRPIYREFTDKCIVEIKKRANDRDLLLCMFGLADVEIANALPNLICCEPGVGYPATFSNFCAYESYAWRHINYGGDDRKNNPKFYDAVIPNWLFMEEYPYYPKEKKKDYAIILCRSIPKKGSNIASDACKAAGIPLYVAGQGGLLPGVEATYLGVLGPEERAKWVGEAMVYLQPTAYVEPFGTAHIEALALGTPCISTDFGVFSETIIHGLNGYRFRIMKDFVWALKNINNINPAVCRKFAETNYNSERVSDMYEDWFNMLIELHEPESKGFYSLDPPVKNLDALYKYYPSLTE